MKAPSQHIRGIGARAAWMVMLCMAWPPAARADEPGPAQAWRTSVPAEKREQAEKHFAAGVALYNNGLISDAEKEFTRALEAWPDNPRILFNLALAKMNLDRLPEAYDHMVVALRHPDALEKGLHEEGTRRLGEMKERLAWLEVKCNEPGAAVTLDGKLLFTGPGAVVKTVMSGQHSLVATKPGYIIVDEKIDLGPGQREAVELALFAYEQVSFLEVQCSEPDTEVFLNGSSFLNCPGSKTEIVKPGKHTIVASKPDFISTREVVATERGERKTVIIDLLSLEEATVTEWPILPWTQWTMIGTGAAMGAIGGALLWRASANFARYDQELSNRCTSGCYDPERSDSPTDVIPDSVLDIRERARWQNRLSTVFFVSGGAVLLSGVALGLFNRPVTKRIVRKKPEPMAIVPVVSPGMLGVAAGLSF